VVVTLDWTFGEGGGQDDLLSSGTRVLPESGPYCEFSQSSVTMTWGEAYIGGSTRQTYTSDGAEGAHVRAQASPYKDGFGAQGVDSEHHVLLGLCYDNSDTCEWSHTLDFSSK
jgi:hypothetical protein